MEKNRKLILEGSLVRAILTLAIPIMLNNLIQSLYNLGDAFWVSRIGDVQVAAVNFVWPISFFTISFASSAHPDNAKTNIKLSATPIIFFIIPPCDNFIFFPSCFLVTILFYTHVVTLARKNNNFVTSANLNICFVEKS